MNKLVFVFFLSIFIAIALLVSALLYIDMTGHKGFTYEILSGDEITGTMRLARYITEDKIVYKADVDKPYALDFAVTNEKLFMDKETKEMFKLDREKVGPCGQKERSAFFRENYNNDYVFAGSPGFITVTGGYINKCDAILVPGDAMLYLALLNRYNFWARGNQFFETIVALDAPVAPFIDRIEISYMGDAYVTVMGKRVQAENYSIKSDTLPEVRVSLSKFRHDLLVLENKVLNEKMKLISVTESPVARIRERFNDLPGILMWKVLRYRKDGGSDMSQSFASGAGLRAVRSELDPVYVKKEEVFINSGTDIISGTLLKPKGVEKFSSIAILIPGDGPVKQGEKLLFSALSDLLTRNDYLVFSFKSLIYPNGEKQFSELDLEVKKNVLKLAVEYAKKLSDYDGSFMVFIGYGPGGYVGLDYAADDPETIANVQLGLLTCFDKKEGQFISKEYIRMIFRERNLFAGNGEKIQDIWKYTDDYIRKISVTEPDFMPFKGFTLPLKQYREYILRAPLAWPKDTDDAVFFVYTGSEKEFLAPVIADVTRIFSVGGKENIFFEAKDTNQYMGTLVDKDDIVTYEPKEEVLRAIDKWLDKVKEKFIGIKKASKAAGEPLDDTAV